MKRWATPATAIAQAIKRSAAAQAFGEEGEGVAGLRCGVLGGANLAGDVGLDRSLEINWRFLAEILYLLFGLVYK